MPCIILGTEDKMVKKYIFLCSRILQVSEEVNTIDHYNVVNKC